MMRTQLLGLLTAICLAGASLLALGQAGGAVAGAPRVDYQDDVWLDRHWSEAFEKLMPMTGHLGEFVAFRQARDLYIDVPERYFLIRIVNERDGDTAGTSAAAATQDTNGTAGRKERLDATIIAPEGASIRRQLLALHRADRNASLDTLLPRIVLRRRETNTATCAALHGRLDALSRVRLVADRGIITLHPLVRQFAIGLGGGTVDVSLQQDDHPLADWATTTLHLLERCAASDPPPA